MYILSTMDCWEQHLEGDCADISKLKIQMIDSVTRRVLKVFAVESVSDGTLRILVDTAKETSSG